MYDPTVGKWISADPIGFDGEDANLYRYVNNSPMNLVDPSGEISLSLSPPPSFDSLAKLFYQPNPVAVIGAPIAWPAKFTLSPLEKNGLIEQTVRVKWYFKSTIPGSVGFVGTKENSFDNTNNEAEHGMVVYTEIWMVKDGKIYPGNGYQKRNDKDVLYLGAESRGTHDNFTLPLIQFDLASLNDKTRKGFCSATEFSFEQHGRVRFINSDNDPKSGWPPSPPFFFNQGPASKLWSVLAQKWEQAWENASGAEASRGWGLYWRKNDYPTGDICFEQLELDKNNIPIYDDFNSYWYAHGATVSKPKNND